MGLLFTLLNTGQYQYFEPYCIAKFPPFQMVMTKLSMDMMQIMETALTTTLGRIRFQNMRALIMGDFIYVTHVPELT